MNSFPKSESLYIGDLSSVEAMMQRWTEGLVRILVVGSLQSELFERYSVAFFTVDLPHLYAQSK